MVEMAVKKTGAVPNLFLLLCAMMALLFAKVNIQQSG
jgi:hypothetical protein